MPNPIPTKQRKQVQHRDGGRCAKCGGPGAHWHHRRTRTVVDEHQHCTCNGVWLCTTCHSWVHHNPNAAQTQGFIVSRYESFPGEEPVLYPDGWWALDCNGTGSPVWRKEAAGT